MRWKGDIKMEKSDGWEVNRRKSGSCTVVNFYIRGVDSPGSVKF